MTTLNTAQSAASGKKLEVLIIEDSVIDAELMVHELTRCGYDVSWCRVDSAAALQSVLMNRSWDVVLSDYVLPSFSGLEALNIIKTSGLDLPFILISGTIGEEIAVEAMHSGADDYLLKDRLARLGPAVERQLREVESRQARKRAEVENENLLAQLLQAQKMEAVGRLAGGVAHDFNNNLSIIIGYVELARNKLSRNDPLLFDLEEILKAARRSAELTRHLLAFSRRQIIEPKVIDLNKIIGDSKKMISRLVGEDIECSFIPQADLWLVRIDPAQVDQIMTNLAINARDAMPAGGKLTIRTDNLAYAESIYRKQKGFTPGDYVRLTISDSGCGMEKDVLEHIFEPFFTTKDPGKGTGLGLSTVYGIVKQNNGFIDVQSEVGAGTTFSIYLSRNHGQLEKAEEKEISIPVSGSETVLLVEDEEQILTIGEIFLKRHGYKVLTANHPDEALNICKKYPDQIHLLITDVVMPAMNGQELKDKIEKMRPGIKVLFMSGYMADTMMHRRLYDHGEAFIQKPFMMNDFINKVKDVLEQ
jgi:signal transduction histidine kinase